MRIQGLFLRPLLRVRPLIPESLRQPAVRQRLGLRVLGHSQQVEQVLTGEMRKAYRVIWALFVDYMYNSCPFIR